MIPFLCLQISLLGHTACFPKLSRDPYPRIPAVKLSAYSNFSNPPHNQNPLVGSSQLSLFQCFTMTSVLFIEGIAAFRSGGACISLCHFRSLDDIFTSLGFEASSCREAVDSSFFSFILLRGILYAAAAAGQQNPPRMTCVVRLCGLFLFPCVYPVCSHHPWLLFYLIFPCFYSVCLSCLASYSPSTPMQLVSFLLSRLVSSPSERLSSEIPVCFIVGKTPVSFSPFVTCLNTQNQVDRSIHTCIHIIPYHIPHV